MAAKTEELVLDRSQVKKAVQALQAFLKAKSTPEFELLEESQQISLLFTLWKVPKKAQTVRIPLPHGQRSDTDEVCLFTRDEPRMSPEQTERFYKKLLQENGVKNITEIIPYKVLRTEYKPFEAKRRLLGNFDMFLSDSRIRRLLPSHIGKHFYERKKEPLCVNLQSKHLARDIASVIQGTSMKVSKKGCCCMARVAHSGLSADEVTDNIEATVKTVIAKLRTKGPVIKLIHVKSQTSVSLPIYTSDLGHLTLLEDAEKEARAENLKRRNQPKKRVKKNLTKKTDADPEEEDEYEDEEEEAPELVSMVTPRKRPRLQRPNKKKGLEKTLKPAAGKRGPRAKKAGKSPQRRKRST